MEILNAINELVETLREDARKFYDKANKSAGTRARKSAQDLKKALQDLRMDIINKSKN